MIKRCTLGLTAALAISASPAFAATNLVTNGSFETNANFSQPYVEVGAGDPSITGWTVDSGTVDWIGSYWQAKEGSHSLDLAGSSLGTISQGIATVAGQYYTVTFYASKNPDGGDAERTGTVSFGGQDEQFEYALVNSLADMNWQLYSFTFMATGASTLLSFAADTSAGCCYGPALDNVSMIASVPEPEVWAMLLFGLGAVGFQMRRRRSLRTVTA